MNNLPDAAARLPLLFPAFFPSRSGNNKRSSSDMKSSSVLFFVALGFFVEVRLFSDDAPLVEVMLFSGDTPLVRDDCGSLVGSLPLVLFMLLVFTTLESLVGNDIVEEPVKLPLVRYTEVKVENNSQSRGILCHSC